MSNLSNQNSARFKANQILHLALVMGATMMCLVMGFLITRDGEVQQPINWFEGYPLYAMVLMALEIAASYVVWNKRQSNIPVNGTEEEKWNYFQSASILRWALLEGGILISIILAFLDANIYGLAIPLVGIGFLVLARPSRDYLADNYGLDARG